MANITHHSFFTLPFIILCKMANCVPEMSQNILLGTMDILLVLSSLCL